MSTSAMLALLAALATANAEPPLLLRARNFIVNPSTGPVTHVVVKNRGAADYSGTLKVQFPDGWKVKPAECALALRPGEAKRFPFTIENATDREANAYPVRIIAEGTGGRIEVEQTVVCASAPYFKPKIDGELDEWKDSIPITFSCGGKKTVARAYWSNKQFSLAIEVEEEALTPRDAVQFALAPEERSKSRYEFLVLGSCCWRLVKDGPLAGQETKDVAVCVKRAGKFTNYEIGVPFKLMPEIQPSAGREICFGLLVHDPDGTGVRDLGTVMNRWEEDRRPHGWCLWENVKWGAKPPFDANVEFGFCSSIH